MNPQAANQTADDAQPSLIEFNQWLSRRSASARIEWALKSLAGAHVLSSSFGAQSAVALHLATQIRPDLPVILIDTGYLFPETYDFIRALCDRLRLNLNTYRPAQAVAWSASEVAQLEQRGSAGIEHYNRVHKVEPMQRALNELDAGTWIAGLRRSQASTRAQLPYLTLKDARWKLHPLADWSERDIGHYLSQHHLPYHPLWEHGFVSIGDVHSTRAWQPGMRAEDTRFFGLKRECGLHAETGSEPDLATFALPQHLQPVLA